MTSNEQVAYLVEKHRYEYENILITLINQGWDKGSAKAEAAERIFSRYCNDEVLLAKIESEEDE
jgi:hypothetical protein